jgi:hypothetical protein
MFYERVSAGGSSGRTVSQMLERYGFPPRRADLLKAILTLPQNVPLMQASGGKIELDTDLTRFAGQMRGVASLCLPIDFQAAHSGVPVVQPGGLRPGKLIKPTPTHGVSVRFVLVFGSAPLADLEGRDVYRCPNVRWLQTAKKKNSPYPGLPTEFVDGGDAAEDGDRWPWYDSGELWKGKAWAEQRVELTDLPGGPEGVAGSPPYHFLATTSCAVRTENRVTLIESFTWGFEIMPGKTPVAVHWNPSIRPATAAEVQEQLRILRLVAISPLRNPTGRHHDYRPPPPSDSINE